MNTKLIKKKNHHKDTKNYSKQNRLNLKCDTFLTNTYQDLGTVGMDTRTHRRLFPLHSTETLDSTN